MTTANFPNLPQWDADPFAPSPLVAPIVTPVVRPAASSVQLPVESSAVTSKASSSDATSIVASAASPNGASAGAKDTAAVVPKVAATTNYPLIDVARLLAAYGVVWIHTPSDVAAWDTSFLGRFAVPFFVATSIYFVFRTVRARPDRSSWEYARSRSWRLYSSFLVWTAIYLVFKLAKKVAAPSQPTGLPGWEVFWVGGMYHLWFIPFILLVSVTAFVVAKWATGGERRELHLAWLTAIVGAAAAFCSPPAWLASSSTGPYMWNAAPSIFFGVALAIAHPAWLRRGDPRVVRNGWSIALGLACLAYLALFDGPRAGGHRLAENLAGVAVLIVALENRPAWANGDWSSLLASLSLGVYLSHLLFLKTFEALAGRCGWSWTESRSLAAFFVCATASTLLAWALHRSPRTRWLVQ